MREDLLLLAVRDGAISAVADRPNAGSFCIVSPASSAGRGSSDFRLAGLSSLTWLSLVLVPADASSEDFLLVDPRARRDTRWFLLLLSFMGAAAWLSLLSSTIRELSSILPLLSFMLPS